MNPVATAAALSHRLVSDGNEPRTCDHVSDDYEHEYEDEYEDEYEKSRVSGAHARQTALKDVISCY